MNLTKLPLKMKGLASSGSLETGSDLEYFSPRFFAFTLSGTWRNKIPSSLFPRGRHNGRIKEGWVILCNANVFSTFCFRLVL